MKSIKILIISILYCLTASGDYWEVSNRSVSTISANNIINENQAKTTINNCLSFAKNYNLENALFLKTLKACIDEKIQELENNKVYDKEFIDNCFKIIIASAITAVGVSYHTLITIEKKYGYYDTSDVNAGTLATLCTILTIVKIFEIKRVKNNLKYYDSELEKFKLVRKTITQLL